LKKHFRRIFILYISRNSTPYFSTINNFCVARLKDSIQNLFAEVVKMIVETGYVSLDVQYIDGTKIGSKSNRYIFVWWGSIEKYKKNQFRRA